MTSKTSIYLAVALLVSVSLMTGVFGQPQPPNLTPRGMNIKKLPPGMTQLQLQQRIAPIVARLKAESASHAQQSQREGKAIFDALANERAAITAAFNKDPRYKTFVEQARSISAGGGTSEAKAQQLKTLAKANQGIFNDAVRVAKINPNALQAKIQAISPGAALMPDLTVRKRTLKRMSALQSSPQGPPANEIVLQPPFTFEDYDSDHQGIAYSDAEANPNADDGKARSRVTVVGVAGSGKASATFGEHVSVPAGVKRVEFTVSSKLSYDGNALAVVALGFVDDILTVSVRNEAANQYDEEVIIDSVGALVGWYAEMEGGTTKDYKFSFNVSDQAREYFIAGNSYVFALAGGLGGYANGHARTEINKITVKYFYE